MQTVELISTNQIKILAASKLSPVRIRYIENGTKCELTRCALFLEDLKRDNVVPSDTRIDGQDTWTPNNYFFFSQNDNIDREFAVPVYYEYSNFRMWKYANARLLKTKGTIRVCLGRVLEDSEQTIEDILF
jgi:hypothetical protein